MDEGNHPYNCHYDDTENRQLARIRSWSYLEAHKLPRQKMPIRAIFRDFGICSLHNMSSGRNRITMSVRVFGIVCASKKPLPLMQVPGTD